jgi:hypothetical protein
VAHDEDVEMSQNAVSWRHNSQNQKKAPPKMVVQLGRINMIVIA